MSSKMGRREFIGASAVSALVLPAMLKGMEESSEAAEAKKSGMRVIALEEHAGTPQLTAALKAVGINARDSVPALAAKLNDLGAKRLADMDAAGIDMQVLSVAGDGLEKLDRNTGIAVARDINDMLANAVKSHPDRFAAFAVLPLQAPDAAAAELERCVTKVGFKGALISGTINGLFLDNPVFQPVFAAAERLDVPIYLHPAPPPPGSLQSLFRRPPDPRRRIFVDFGLGLARRDRNALSPPGGVRLIRPFSEAADHHWPYGREPSVLAGPRRRAPDGIEP
jgi:hypothetical protein